MTDITASKFSNIFRIKAVIFTLFVFGSTITTIVVFAENYDTYNWGKILCLVLYLVLLLAIYIYVTVRSVRSITAAPEGIIINYLITKRQIIINYSDIVHVSNVRTNGNRDDMLFPSYLKLEIELCTGEYLSFTENDFTNYDELKEAIREYRFHLN